MSSPFENSINVVTKFCVTTSKDGKNRIFINKYVEIGMDCSGIGINMESFVDLKHFKQMFVYMCVRGHTLQTDFHSLDFHFCCACVRMSCSFLFLYTTWVTKTVSFLRRAKQNRFISLTNARNYSNFVFDVPEEKETSLNQLDICTTHFPIVRTNIFSKSHYIKI